MPTPEQHEALLSTIERANEACNYASDIAWQNQTFRQFPLHKRVYRDIRDRFELSAQMAIRVEGKVADAYKLDRKTKRDFTPHGAIAYDDRILKWKLADSEVSIWTLEGRQSIGFTTGERQHKWLAFRQGESDLVYSRGKFYLLATCEVPEPPPEDIDSYLGVDLGVVNIATDSEGNSHSGSHVRRVRVRHRRLRKRLQKKGTKSAKRKLKQLSGKESRFARDVNHCVSKSIVATAQRNRQGIALEELKGIRQRVRARRSQRGDLHSWSFHQLGQCLAYKARLAGIPVVQVDPRNTSKACPLCGHVAKANRPTRDRFHCGLCGHSGAADHIAALNISVRGGAAINRPNVSGVGASTVHAASQGQATDF